MISNWRESWPAGSVVVAIFKYTQTTEILWRKRGCVATLQVLSKFERGPLTPAWTGFYCFSGHITLRAILIYYVRVHHRWLPFKEDKGQDTANYFKEKDVRAQGGSCSHSILGWFTHWRLPIYWLPIGEPIHGCGSCPPTSLPTGFSEWGLSHIFHAWNSSPQWTLGVTAYRPGNCVYSGYHLIAQGGRVCNGGRYQRWFTSVDA